jgi:fructokinase
MRNKTAKPWIPQIKENIKTRGVPRKARNRTLRFQAAAFDAFNLSSEALLSLKTLEPDWLYFGTLFQTDAHVEQMTRSLVESLHGTRCFYDLNLRPGSWNLPLVERLCRLASIVKLNEFEAQTLATLTGVDPNSFSLENFCANWASRYEIESICVTLGAAGCLVYENGTALTVPGFPASVEDTVGAGDAFAAAFLHGYHAKWPLLRTARFANALGAIVASRPGATPKWSIDECLQLASISLETASLANGKIEGAHV